MGSSRLPKKVMMEVETDTPIINSVIKQLEFCKTFEKIIVATTKLSEDDVLYEYVNSQNIDCFRGSADDVLDRYYQCAKKFSLDDIIRITSDNPLIDPIVVDQIVQNYFEKKCDYATNTIPRTYPYGTEVEVFSFPTLEKTWKNSKKLSEREHVTPFMKNPLNKFSIFNLKHSENLTHLRYTVDEINDFNLVQKIFQNISNRPILTSHITQLYSRKSEIFKINQNIKHKEVKIN